ncbi:MAG TPA: hypothetical protein VLG09_05410 [Candidatus Saccharimonadales bacterium]|nr:hypothetical protein [Candidatus Saccharimonadales bacterium]
MPRTTKKTSSKQSADTTGFINRSDSQHVAYLNEQKHIFSAASDYFVAETNETERALCAQLMLIDTVLLTGTLVALANKDIADILTVPVRILVLLALCFLLVSIAFGIKYYFAVKSYNKRWALAKHDAMKAFLDPSVKTWGQLRKKTDDYQVDIPQELAGPWLRLQILFIASAALFYVAALFGLLFNVSDIAIHSYLWLSGL